MSEELLDLDLETRQWDMLYLAVNDWGGPVEVPADVARLLNLDGVGELADVLASLRTKLRARVPMDEENWRRAILLTEVAYASDILGVGRGWGSIHAEDDAYWMRLLRGIQAKFSKATR